MRRYLRRGVGSLSGVWLVGGLLLGCSGNTLSGTVGGLQLTVEDGFYTEFTWNSVPYYGVVLTDIPDACNTFNADGGDWGTQYGVLQLWLTEPDLTNYPVYSLGHLDEASDNYSVSWYSVVINSKEVVNTDGVAGVVQVTDFQFDDKILSGTMDVIFSGNGNRLQGSFSVPYCEVDWEEVSHALLASAL